MPGVYHVVLNIDDDGGSHADSADSPGEIRLDGIPGSPGNAEPRNGLRCSELLGFLGCRPLGRFLCPALRPTAEESCDEASDRTDAGADGRPDPGRNHTPDRST